MAYADSAIDYNWEIDNLDLDNRKMTVKYTADSSRPAVYRSYFVGANQFNESDLTAIATDQDNAITVVTIWDKTLEARAENPGFDPNTLIGNSYSTRFKTVSADSVPAYNSLTHTISSYDSEGADDIRTKYNIVAMSDSAKEEYRSLLSTSRNHFWTGLQSSGYLTTATTALAIEDSYGTYDNEDVDFLTSEVIGFGDSVSMTIQSAVGLNDSDWASWMITSAYAVSNYEA